MNIGILLRSPFNKLVEEIHEELARRGHPEIRPAHGTVFQFIGKHGARITDMAEKAHMTKQSMSYLVEYLEERGYVERRPDETDRRAMLFSLTKKGWKVVDAAEKAIANVQKDWEKRMGKSAYRQLTELLARLNDAIR